MSDHADYVDSLGRRARAAAAALVSVSGRRRDDALRAIARRLRDGRARLIAENAKDVEASVAGGLATAMVERLRLDERRVEAMAASVEAIAGQVDPVGRTIEAFNRPDGLRIERRRVPIGTILFFYESRPNVTSDAAALCLKSGNAVILRGGKEALHSNLCVGSMIAESLEEAALPAAAVQVVSVTDRAVVPLLLKADRHIDLVIPRGGESLIRAVVTDATMPVLKHFTGNCHVYLDAAVAGVEQMAIDVCVNAKTSYPGGGACNTVEHILVHADAVASVMTPLCAALASRGVEIRGDPDTKRAWPLAVDAKDADWAEEYLAMIIGIKVVASIDEAIDHINRYGSHHTDAIVSTSMTAIEAFTTRVDSASVMINASTRLADGGEYLLGAEIGISTDKLHARGPMGAADLTTYKWIVTGNGHVRG